MNRTSVIFFSIAIVILCSGVKTFSQTTPDSSQTNKYSEILSEFNNFADLHIGYYGTTQNCLPYNIYGFKYKRTWFLIASQDLNPTLLVAKPPRSERNAVVPGSDFLFLGLAKSNTLLYTKLKKRRKLIKDVKLYGFYKFNKIGKKAIKGLLYLEFPETDLGPSWPFKWVGEKAAEAAESIEGVIPEVTAPEIVLPEVPEIPAIEIPTLPVE